MRGLADLPRIWRRGGKLTRIPSAETSERSLPRGDCSFALEELLGDDFNVDAALAKLAAVPTSGGA